MDHKQTIRPALRCATSPSTGRLYRLKGIWVLILALATPPNANSEQNAMTSERIGWASGKGDFTVYSTAASNKNVDAESFSMSDGFGWDPRKQSIGGVRQKLSISETKGDPHKHEFWNGTPRGYVDSRFGDPIVFPIVGVGQGRSHGGRADFGLSKTFHVGRAEYQWFLRKSRTADKLIDHRPGGYMVGLGYNF